MGNKLDFYAREMSIRTTGTDAGLDGLSCDVHGFITFSDQRAVLSLETNPSLHDEHGIFQDRVEVFEDFAEAPRKNLSGSDLNGKFYLREYRYVEHVSMSVIAHVANGMYVVLKTDINPTDIPAPAKFREFYYEDKPRQLRFGEGQG